MCLFDAMRCDVCDLELVTVTVAVLIFACHDFDLVTVTVAV